LENDFKIHTVTLLTMKRKGQAILEAECIHSLKAKTSRKVAFGPKALEIKPVQRNAEPTLASHASYRDARDAWNGLGVGPLPL
jgi:hypothetical protein